MYEYWRKQCRFKNDTKWQYFEKYIKIISTYPIPILRNKISMSIVSNWYIILLKLKTYKQKIKYTKCICDKLRQERNYYIKKKNNCKHIPIINPPEKWIKISRKIAEFQLTCLSYFFRKTMTESWMKNQNLWFARYL